MGDMESSHSGIDLDTICINDLISKKENAPAGAEDEVRSDPENYRVFVNGIFKKMKGQEAFLSFTRQINNVNQILNTSYSSAGDIARVILKDLALTAQVLKLVNSSFYRQFSKKGISTISEAMIILGTDEVRQIAASLKVYEMMKELANSEILKEKTLKGLQRSIMARQISVERGDKASDTLQISAMVYELGEYLVALFDPGTYIKVEITMEDEGLSREEAAKKVLGLTYSDLGRVVAAKLNLPEDVVQAIRPVTRLKTNGGDLSDREKTRYLCALIHELCDINASETDTYEIAGAITDKYRDLVNIDMRKAMGLIQMSKDKMVRHAELLDIDPVIPKAQSGIKNKKDLDEGRDRVMQALKEKLSIHQIFTRLIDTMDTCFYFNQVIISIKKKQTNTMEPRFIRGERRPENQTRALAFKIESKQDIFNRSISLETDMIVKDAKKEAYSKQVPSWYMDKVVKPSNVKGFAIFPVFVDKKILSMVYLDWDKKAPSLNQKIIDHIREFREMMIQTFTLHSKGG